MKKFWRNENSENGNLTFRDKLNNLWANKKFLDILKWTLLSLLILLAISILIANFFYYKDCPNEDCYIDFMRVCSRAEYVNERNLTLQYNIEGLFIDKCSISVKSLDGSSEGMEMLCRPNKGDVYYPEDNLTVCEGRLKDFLE